MRKSIAIAVTAALLVPLSQAKDKEKDKPAPLPPTFLVARTIVVTIDPDAGVSPTDPNANQIAQKDVEVALANWGRFQPVLSTEHADLIIILRKGTGKLATGTIADPRQNSRPGSVTPSDNGISIGAQHGQPPPISDGGPLTRGDASSNTPRPRAEIGDTNDSFIVEDPDGARWRYDAKDALHHHDVPAVDHFRKVLEEAEKAANTPTPKKSPATPPQTTPTHTPPNQP
jgi:hypothetical protein